MSSEIKDLFHRPSSSSYYYYRFYYLQHTKILRGPSFDRSDSTQEQELPLKTLLSTEVPSPRFTMAYFCADT